MPHPVKQASRRLYHLLLMTAMLTLSGCLGMPDDVEPVGDFELDRYLGQWYEIARLDHAFERGLERVTAQYTLGEEGGVQVVNRGFNPETGQWKEAEGKAYFVDDPGTGYLKVSFFGPFYGSYVIFELGPDYEYAFVSGPDYDYLWLLAREPRVDAGVLERFTTRAQALGFDSSALIMVKHP
ncbi:lipocalin [Marinihelvus fidelis]|uniref:Outer membrane lipoprotein Blc n=1 Tax=Marinihelvus fidelis TaxID=2613842 RepID=A0A5N0TF01_9GAMM|nr:lipocalin family protein [Marinihelvus fidelis]KAA9131829.1 lipocalin [Marinihelvus fidelis]